jgi:hypothetical protein
MIGSLLQSVAGNLDLPQAGVLWVSLIVFVAVFADAQRVRSYRNLALVALWLPSLAFVDYVGLPKRDYAPHVFLGIYLLTVGYAAWCAQIALRPVRQDWTPALSERHLLLLLGIVLVIDTAMVFGLRPDDAGTYTNLGARRWLETGTIPYGDELLRGPDSPAFGAAATYGPLLYVAHMPFQFLTGAAWNAPGLGPRDPGYLWPPALATQLTCYAFFLLGAFCLYRIVRDLKDRRLALGVVTLYAVHPMILGLGGNEYRCGGLLYISHIAPSAGVLAAFMLRRRPALSGVLLAASAGLLFWPAFLFPLWFGWWFWRDRPAALRFAAGAAAAGLAILTVVVVFSRAPEGSNAVSMFLESTLEHQEGTGEREYGSSRHSFWGTHPGAARVFHAPIVGDTSLLKPTFIAFVSLCIAAAFWVRNKSAAQFAALIALLAAGIQLWKTHANGTYVGWYLGFLLVGLTCLGSEADESAKRL